MKKKRAKRLKIWWRFPDIESIPAHEGRDLIYRSLCVASDAFHKFYGILEEPTYFRTCWTAIDLDKGPSMLNYMIGKMNDPRIKYFAEIK